MTQDQIVMSSDHNPVLEQLIEDGIEHLKEAETTSEDWLYSHSVDEALKEFRKAAEIAPHEPWLWIQIGWLNLIVGRVYA